MLTPIAMRLGMPGASMLVVRIDNTPDHATCLHQQEKQVI